MTGVLRFRKHLSGPQPETQWPSDFSLVPLSGISPSALHEILVEAYSNGFGSVPEDADWWPGILADSEFDPALVFVAADTARQPVGFALCWNSGFVKDLAVAELARGRGLGQALLRASFGAFAARGFPSVDLKVDAGNAAAIRLYRRVGMTEAEL